jgi:hypothetical protein
LLNWLLRVIPRRHSPTDGGNRSKGWRELAERIRDTALGIVLVPRSSYVGELPGALIDFGAGVSRSLVGGVSAPADGHGSCGFGIGFHLGVVVGVN